MTDIASIQLKKNDKVVAYILAAIGLLILGSVGYGLFLLMPLLVALAKNTIIFFAELAVLAFMVIGALQLYAERDLFVYKWKNFVRNIRKAIIREDPVGVLDTAIARFGNRLENLEEKITEALGARKTQESKQRISFNKAEEFRSQVLAAQRLHKPEGEQARHAVAAMRWQKAGEEMQPTVDLMTKMQNALEGARDLAANTLEDLKNQREVLKVRLEASLAGKNATRSLKSFFGSSNESDMALMAFDEIERQTNEAEAEIEQFMRVMDPALKGADLKNQAEAIAAMEKFNTSRIQKALMPSMEPDTVTILLQPEPQKVGKQVNPGR